jgi:hypothetical protein
LGFRHPLEHKPVRQGALPPDDDESIAMKRIPTEQSGNVFEANKMDRDLVTEPESDQRVARMIEMDQQYLAMAKSLYAN